MKKYFVATISGVLAVASVLAQEQNGPTDNMMRDCTISAKQANTEYTFRRGTPTGDTAAAVYANSMRRRAIEAYKTFLPTVATEAVIQQMVGAGAVPNQIGIVMVQGPKQQTWS